MKKLILSATVAFTVLATSNIYAQQGFGTNTPDRSSAVDIVSSKRGLLIPRIDLTKTTEAGPVAKPENALFVYNKATANDVTPGFYYWEAANEVNAKEQGLGRWVRFVSSNSGSAVTVSAGTNVTVTPSTNGHDTNYEVSVKGGAEAGNVLVTKIEVINGETIHTTEWVKPQDFINGSVVGVNGVTAEIVGDKVQVGLGGALGKATTIETTAGEKGNTLAISGLEKLDGTDGKEFDATTQNIVIMGTDGILKQVTPEALLEDAIKGGTVDGKALTSKSITVDGNAATSLLKDVNIEVKGGEKDGQILVTKEVKDSKGNVTYITDWVDAAGNTVKSGQGITVGTDNTVNLGGKITNNQGKPGAIIDLTDNNGDKAGDIAIKGLEELVGKDATTGNKLDSGSDKLVIADKDGVLKQTSAKNLIEDAIEKGTDDTDPLKAKTLKGDGITVTAGGTAGTSLSVANSLLKDVTLGIADNAITTNKINNGAVTQDKLYAGTKDAEGVGTPATPGTVPVAGKDGKVTYQNVSTAIGQDLTTDGKIVIGDNKSTLDKLDNAVLVATKLSIKEGSISNVELGTGAVTADKMTAKDSATGSNVAEGSVPVAGEDGKVTYQQVTGESLNGKALTSSSISVFGGNKALLDGTVIEVKGGDTDGLVLVSKEKKVVVGKNPDGTDKIETIKGTEWIDAGSLGNTVTASNGLTKTDNDIALGGSITNKTVLAIASAITGENAKPAGSLSITGLNTADSKQGNKTVVVQADGQLATIDTAAGNVTINQGGDVNISDNSVVNNYHPSMEEIVIEVTLGDNDTNLNLPAVNGTEGQTISVKIVNINEKHKGYLNIKSTDGDLAYGAMPFQGWIIKSNGTKWIVVGRN